MISYCIVCFRPTYAALLINDIVIKTSAPFEILLWLNVEDRELEQRVEYIKLTGVDITVVGKTPENICMKAYLYLFRKSKFELVVQIDDDVVAISRKIAEKAQAIFRKYKNVKQLVADVWCDEFTTGARPSWENYNVFNRNDNLFSGPIDGWFSIYHRSIIPHILKLPIAKYYFIGAAVKNMIRRKGLYGVLCSQFKVFHVIGPTYASYFKMLDFEINKYKSLGRDDIVRWYENGKNELPPKEILKKQVQAILASIDSHHHDN